MVFSSHPAFYSTSFQVHPGLNELHVIFLGSRKAVFLISPLRFDSRSIPFFRHAPYSSLLCSRGHRPLLVPASLASPRRNPRHREHPWEVQSPFRRSSWSKHMNVKTEPQPLSSLSSFSNFKKIKNLLFIMVTCTQQISIAVMEINCHTEWQNFDWLKCFNSLSNQWVYLKPIPAFQLLAVLTSCNTEMSSLYFQITALGLTELVLMQKSLNAVKPYTKQIKSHSKGHPEVFVSQTSAHLQRRRRLMLLGTARKPQGLKALQKNFLLKK